MTKRQKCVFSGTCAEYSIIEMSHIHFIVHLITLVVSTVKKQFQNLLGENIVSVFTKKISSFNSDFANLVLSYKKSNISHVLINNKKPNEHYIELKKDFSNIDEVIKKMKDDKIKKQIVDRAYEYIINIHTYKHRIEYLLKEITL